LAQFVSGAHVSSPQGAWEYRVTKRSRLGRLVQGE
jgi:hypothetical protein